MKFDLWDPSEEIKAFRDEMEKMMEGFWEKEKSLMKQMNVKEPSIDIEDKKDELEITVDLPGVDKKGIVLNVERDKVEIKAQVKREAEVKKKNFYRQERAVSGFYRSFPLPAIVDPDKAKSTFKDGILKIILPKVKELPRKKRRIAIK